MAITNVFLNYWAASGYLMRTASIIYAAPIAIWGVCTIEAVSRCALRASHTAVSFNQKSRIDRWKATKTHLWTAYGTGLLTGVSLVPVLGTYRSYGAMIKMVINHMTNTWCLRELQQRANSHAADTLYQELNAWEPNLDQIFSNVIEKVAPTKQEIDETANKLRASLIGSNWIFTTLFHTIDGTCRALKIVAIRIARLISSLVSGGIIRVVVRSTIVIKDGIKQQVHYICNLIEQPGRGDVPKRSLPEMYLDNIYCVLNQCDSNDSRELARLGFACHSDYRKFAIDNAITQMTTNILFAPPPGAPNHYFHALRMLPRACTHFSKVKNTKTAEDVTKEKTEIVNYFKDILPVMDTFDDTCMINMTGEAKQELLWELTKRMPNLREITLDMHHIDPRWQMLIAVQLAKFSPNLSQVKFLNADHRTILIMRRFCRWFCTIK